MRLTRDQVEQISQRIVYGLLREGHVATDRPEAVIDRIAQIFTDNLAAEDKLSEEAHELLKSYSDEIARGAVNYQELFRKVKSKLARDRKMII